MWQTVLALAKQALHMDNIQAESGYPSEKYQDITEPVCRVNLKAVEMFSGKYTVAVQVVSPATLGAEGCEQMAHRAAKELMNDANECQIGPCSFDGRTGLFSMEITAIYETDAPKIQLDGTSMKYVRTFTSWREEGDGTVAWDQLPWEFELVEQIPWGEVEQTLPEGTFTLIHTGNGIRETFHNCVWTYRKREIEPGGFRQIWRGRAPSREVTATT